ncbi:MAG TPA: hypothetical protein VEX64_03220, partial [Pyrinomonadaceae bacterium]|nr:hypothetical protein [Pyrinomonadaceae bacterium]
MAKEMIVSVNGREKKIAILEDGKVTEFYIERGEENSGVVGNIYKGRVMRVLPGMQSAFVDIGLERDAFLYVSDFFDEEEEFERIVMEKSKKADMGAAEKAAAERLKQARLEREQAMEAAQERAEPIIAAEVGTIEDFIEELPQEMFDEISAEPEIKAPQTRDKQPRERQPRERFSRERNTGEKTGNRRGGDESREKDIQPIAAPVEEREEEESVLTPFVADDSNFERIIDDEEQPGDLFKEARIQERLTDQVRAVEFDFEPSTPSIEVGSLQINTDNGGFERIADDDEEPVSMAETVEPETDKRSNRRGGRGRGGKAKQAGSKAAPASVEEAATEEASPTEPPLAFASEPEPQSGENRRGSRGGRGAKKQAAGQATENTIETPEAAKKTRGGRGSGKNRGNKLSEVEMQNEDPKNQSEAAADDEASRDNQAVESDSSESR